MKIIKLTALVLLLIIPDVVSAQVDTTGRPAITYYNQIMSGVLLGKKVRGNTFTCSTVHGFRYKRLAAGAGIGYDVYAEWETMPVFISLAYDFTAPSKNYAFVELNFGVVKAWHSDIPWDWRRYKRERGRFIHPSVGYRIKADQWSIYLKAGYKFQRILYDEYWQWNESVMHVERDMERLTVQLGFGLH